MSVEIVFSGLCSFLNIDSSNPLIVDPSVIVVRTDLKIPHAHASDNGDISKDVVGHIHAQHVPVLAFDSTKVLVSDARGFQRASRVDPLFWYRELDGVLLIIQGVKPPPLTIDPSYSRVVNKDEYWPAATKQYNNDFVPLHGGFPKKSAVHAFLSFGGGTIKAQRLSRVQWKFNVSEKPAYINYFAEEVVYSDFVTDDQVTIEIQDLASKKLITELTFSLRSDNTQNEDVTLFIGNNTEDGLKEAFRRESDANSQPRDGSHIAFLNQVADPNVREPAPIPVPVPKPDDAEDAEHSGSHTVGGPSAGFCGPGRG